MTDEAHSKDPPVQQAVNAAFIAHDIVEWAQRMEAAAEALQETLERAARRPAVDPGALAEAEQAARDLFTAVFIAGGEAELHDGVAADAEEAADALTQALDEAAE